MRKVNYPQCGSPAARVGLIDGYKFYCCRCGWNHEIVQGELSSAVKEGLLLVALLVAVGVVVCVRNPNEGWTCAGIRLAFSGLPISYALSAFLQLRKLRTLSIQPATDHSPAFAVSEMASPGVPSRAIAFKDKEFPELAALPRPRKLKMAWKGRFYVVFAMVLLSLFTVYGLPVLWSESPRTWSLVPGVVAIYGYSLAFFRNRLRERRLLANGKLASGYVHRAE